MLPPVIAIEGIDGAGKATQARLLADACGRFGQRGVVFSFPDYETPTGKLIAAYLRGEVKGDPRLLASMYSLNRLEKLAAIQAALADPDTVVIFDRYTASNIHHVAHFVDQGLGTASEIQSFIDHVEFSACKAVRIPGQCNILLDVPEAYAQKQVADKAARAYTRGMLADIHEADARHLSSTNDIFRATAKAKSWKTVNCVEVKVVGSLQGVVMRTAESISEEIIAHLISL
jgi:dTMP kinase